jgi:peptidoglycan/xylan/chitin deacetylase (PgdA/CDA1 family)
MSTPERSLVETVLHAEGKCGGFPFGGSRPEGVTVCDPLPAGTVFPNGARAALLLTFDVEGDYGNGVGDVALEVANYRRMTARLRKNNIPATFNIVGKMAEDYGPEFVTWMLDAGCEVATHGYVHDLNKRHGGDRVYAGHYGPRENRQQVEEGVRALNRIRPGCVRGARVPYAHFNEYTYDAIADLGLAWASHVGIDDMERPELGFGPAPFRMQLGKKRYPVVEIPLDSQTFDWSIWAADETANGWFVNAARRYCETRGVPFVRTPAGAVAIWERRMKDAIENQTMFTLLCHPMNLTMKDPRWGDPVDEFMLPVIDLLGELHRRGEAWVPTCGQMADFYNKTLT